MKIDSAKLKRAIRREKNRLSPDPPWMVQDKFISQGLDLALDIIEKMEKGK
jgi:hypothetical protein